MKVFGTAIPGVLIIEPKSFGDARGFFKEIYESERYAGAGLKRPFLQDNLSRSTHGVLRGLHLQNPGPQGKLVTVLRGRVLDVAVDVRRGSPTFAKHVAVELDDETHRQLWVPRGFAHGFVVLSEAADVFYKCDGPYIPKNEIAVRWNDPTLNIDWKLAQPHLSVRDAAALALAEIPNLPYYDAGDL
jgi:dTDP-4-dehydrorhamnose 3,5-epimerase